MDKNISSAILSVCKKHGIDYQSINPNYTKFYEDATRLGGIIFEIESLIDEIDVIFSRHNIENGLAKKMESDLEELSKIKHDLVNLAARIKEEK